jgi:alanine racemase
VYSAPGIEALAKAVVEVGGETDSDPLPVHLKVDTGMHRVGCPPTEVIALVDAVDARPELELEGIWTHLAVADQPDNSYTDEQLDQFDAVLDALTQAGKRPPMVHASNSAGTLGHERARYDLVRCGITLYGIPPSPEMADSPGVQGAALKPALSITSHVSHVKTLAQGSRLSYGLHYEVGQETRIATVPIGYADGVPRNLGLTGGEVLIRGRRCPIAGSVTMDQLMVDVGDVDREAGKVEVGDEVVLLGRQGEHMIAANDWAERLGVIGYEVTTRLGPRLPRRYIP